jgi:DNA-directed RNA polymerases I, II, and III subunit RPABC1
MDKNVSRLWKVYKTVHEMVSDRGFLVSSSELDMSLDHFVQQYSRGGVVDRSLLTFLVQHQSSPDDQLLVFFSDDDGNSVGIKTIRKICERMISQVNQINPGNNEGDPHLPKEPDPVSC